MSQHVKNLYILWLGTLLASISFSLVGPFLPLFLRQDLGVSSDAEGWSGLLFSSTFFTSALVSPLWGSLADRYGRKVMIIRAGLGIGAVNLLMSFVTNPYQLLGLRVVNGLMSGFIPSSIALVATNTPEELIGRYLGLLQTGSAVGTVLGPLVGGLLSHLLGIRETFFLAGLTIFLATVIVIFGVKETRHRQPEQGINILGDLREAFQNRTLATALIISLIIQAALMVLQPVIALYIAELSQQADSSLATGVIFSLAGLAAIIAAPFWGKQGDRIGFKRVMVLSLLIAGLFNLPQAAVQTTFQFGLFRFLFGLALAGVSLATNGLVARVVSPDFRGRAYGISNSFSQMGAVAGPLFGGFWAEALGIRSLFFVAGLFLLGSSLAVSRLLPEAKTQVLR
ncbi:MAG: MFS transporter [Firmicutes bacterium]|nr:MFS transporter [Bacillota bacterium]